ncbi:DUF5719 family protein [Gleimia europaea]|uniref:Secreted protein n=1 Tax=Gleimia europaea ACS-120-V-Col10b TaxID=883069 RepID=A0A9W5REC8_9ACTO|nr:DUF5719 family protein [Gleimia europaea]EPD30812.1 hypothetical protein HMPREF9238_00567 [Gleimia europaea ACS-120-V-Col10b]
MKHKWSARSATRAGGAALTAALAVAALGVVATAESSIDFGQDVGRQISEVVTLPDQTYELACATGIETEFGNKTPTKVSVQDIPGVELARAVDLATGKEITGAKGDGGIEFESKNPIGLSVHSTVETKAPSAIVGQVDTEDVRGLVLDQCQTARNDSWLNVGATTVGEAALLTVMNPSKQASEVTLHGWSSTGPVEGEPTFTVRAGSTETVNLAAFFPDEDRLGLRVQASGPGVAATIRTISTAGLTPRGLDHVTGSGGAARTALISGIVKGIEEPKLRLQNVGEDEAQVTLSVLTQKGKKSLPGGDDVVIDPRAVFQLNLDGIEDDYASVLVESSEVLLASASGYMNGQKDQDGKALADRVVWMPAEAAVTFRESLPAAPGVSYALYLSNSGDEDVAVRVNGKETTLVAGHTISQAVTGSDLKIDADAPVHASVNAIAEVASGNLISALALQDSTSGTPTFRFVAPR